MMARVKYPLDRKYNLLGYGLLGMPIGDHLEYIIGAERSILLGSGPFPSLGLWTVHNDKRVEHQCSSLSSFVCGHDGTSCFKLLLSLFLNHGELYLEL